MTILAATGLSVTVLIGVASSADVGTGYQKAHEDELLVDESLAEVADGYNDLDEDALLVNPPDCVSWQYAYYHECYMPGRGGGPQAACEECGPCCTGPTPQPTTVPPGWKDVGAGTCRVVENGKPVEAPTNYKYFGGCGAECCEGKCGGKACGGYEVSDDGNCLIWLTTPGQVLAADSSMNWGNARCIVKVPGSSGLRSIKTKNAPKRAIASERRRFGRSRLQDVIRYENGSVEGGASLV